MRRADRREPSEPLYDAVALGMWAYTRAAFRVRTLFPSRFVVRRGSMLVATHRADSDVPLICASIYLHAGVWRRSNARLHFAARDDLFEQGFFAGFPPGLPIGVRRLLWPIDAGPYLPLVRVNPLPYPDAETMRLAAALADVPGDTPLAGLVPDDALEALQERASALGRPEPSVVADVRRGEFADLLWRGCSRAELRHPLFEAAWRRRAEKAAADVRRVVELVRSGEPVLFFPEGRLSPDGAVGPLRPGLGLVVRRGRPESLQPIGIAYDPITMGRPYAYVAASPPMPPPVADVDGAVTAALCRALPLTAGQLAATALLEAAQRSERLSARELDERLARAVAEDELAGRRIEPSLCEDGGRRQRIADALRWAVHEGLARRDGRRGIALNAARVLADGRLHRLAREHASATMCGQEGREG